MLVKLSGNITINVETGKEGRRGNIPLVFLHGFTGSSLDWTGFFDKLPDRVFPVAIDLIGHGKSSSPEDVNQYTAEAITGQLNELLLKLDLSKPVMAGYSMGGRAALSFAAKYPRALRGLFLESSTAGITGEAERTDRIKSDEMLAEFIEGNSIENFVDYWIDIPLFDSQKKLPPYVLEKAWELKLNNNKTGLANSLRGFSTGRMPELWSSLGKIEVKTCLVTGRLDKKFTEINRLMQEELPDSEHIIVDGTGHNIHLERPEVFLNLLNGFLNKF